MSDEENGINHQFQSMSLGSVEIPEITSLLDLAKTQNTSVNVGDVTFGPRAVDFVQSECAPRILDLLSANAHNDWICQKIIISLHESDAETVYQSLGETSRKILQKQTFQKAIKEKTSGVQRACLERVNKDTQKLARIRNLFAHGVFGHASNLEGYFLVFEPAGLTKAHARYTTFDHQAEHPFARDPIQDMQERFDRSLPDPDSIKVWDKETLEAVLEACHYVGRSLNMILETLKPHPLIKADSNEVYQILSHYGAVSTDLELYFALRQDCDLYQIDEQH